MEYITEYGIPVPDEAIRLFESRNWQPPELSLEESRAVYAHLSELFVAKPDEGGITIYRPKGK